MESSTLPIVNMNNPIRDAIQNRMANDRDHAYSTIINNASKKLQVTIEKFAKKYDTNKTKVSNENKIQPINTIIKEPFIKEELTKIKDAQKEVEPNKVISLLEELKKEPDIKIDKQLSDEIENVISELDIMNDNFKKGFKDFKILSDKLTSNNETKVQPIKKEEPKLDNFVKAIDTSNKKLAKNIINAIKSNDSASITEADLDSFGTRMHRQNTSGSLLDRMPLGTPGDPIYMVVNNLDDIVNPMIKELKKPGKENPSDLNMPSGGIIPLRPQKPINVPTPEGKGNKPRNAPRGPAPEIPNKPSPTLGERARGVAGAVGKGLMRGATAMGAVELADAVIGLDDTLKDQLTVGAALLTIPGSLGTIAAGIYGATQVLDFAMEKYMPEEHRLAGNLGDIDIDIVSPEELQGAAIEQPEERKKESGSGGEGFQKFNEGVQDFLGGITSGFNELTEGLSKTQVVVFGHTFGGDTSKMQEQAEVLAQTSEKNKVEKQKEQNAVMSSLVTNAVSTLNTSNTTVNNVYNTTQKVVTMIDPAISSATGSNTQ